MKTSDEKTERNTMDAEKRARLEAKGYKLMDYAEFLGLSPEEQAIIEMRRALARILRDQRLAQGIPQSTVAAKVRTTQRRVSLMESADNSISLDKLFAANFALGVQPSELLKRVSGDLSDPFIDHRPKPRASSRKRPVKAIREPATG